MSQLQHVVKVNPHSITGIGTFVPFLCQTLCLMEGWSYPSI